MRFLLLLIFAVAIGTAGAAEGVPPVPEGGFLKWAIDFLIVIVISLIGIVYRAHLRDYDEHKKSVNQRFEDVGKEIDDGLRKEEFQRMQGTIHDSIDRLRSDMLRYRTEDSSALAKAVNEIYEDVKESREESRRLSKEIWRQIEDTREKMNNQQIALARSYHTKEEISQLLDSKLDPMLSILRTIQNPAYSGPRRREDQI
jgi:hypothetical protein